MRAMPFEEQNAVYTADGCEDLPARKFQADAVGNDHKHGMGFSYHCIETRWTPTQAERQAIINGGAIVLKVMGIRQPPIMIETMYEGRIVRE